jgi:hypothetical protein
MLNSFRALLLIAGLTLGQLVIAAEPDSFSNQYVSSALGFRITVTHELARQEDGTYLMQFHAKSWLGEIIETSLLRWDDEKELVIPLTYTYKRRGVGRNRDAELSFDWDNHTVINKVQDTRWKMDITQKVQDKLSYQLQLQQDLRDGQTQFTYQIADGGRLKSYGFEVVGEEVLSTPLGKINTVKVKRSRENDERATYAWLAKEHHYLLVRMQQEEKGKTYDIDIRSARINGETLKPFN